MIIAPQTRIYILKNCPLDSTYEHTVYWGASDTRETQKNFFMNYVKYSRINQTYQRVDKGWCAVEINAEYIYDCNYLIFQNGDSLEMPAFDDDPITPKWFYCFIKSVEYMNNKTAKINFEIDVLQTWHFDYDLAPCYIDRIHFPTDVKGEHILEEHVERGDYWYDDEFEAGYGQLDLGENYIVIAGTVRPKSNATYPFHGDVDESLSDIEDAPGGGTYYGVYSGLVFNVFKYAQTANEFIEAVTESNKADGIINIFMAPAKFFRAKPYDYNRDTGGSSVIEDIWDRVDFVINGTMGYSGDAVDYRPDPVETRLVWPDVIPDHYTADYSPRNHKLLCWPYMMITVTNNNGVSGDFRYEFFTADTAVFNTVMALSSTPEAITYPRKYKRVEHNYLEKLVINDFPQCAYNTDAYKAWLAQNANKLVTGFVTDALGATAGIALAATGAGALVGGGMAISSAYRVMNRLGEMADHQTLPPHARGSQSNIAMTALGAQGFRFYCTHITKFYAMLIDKFFDRFGYVCNEIDVPNRSNRPIFTYVKTLSCELVPKRNGTGGGLPAEVQKKITELYNAGIAWWNPAGSIVTSGGATLAYDIGVYSNAVFENNQAPHTRNGG